jgi:hypothetical protein
MLGPRHGTPHPLFRARDKTEYQFSGHVPIAALDCPNCDSLLLVYKRTIKLYLDVEENIAERDTKPHPAALEEAERLRLTCRDASDAFMVHWQQDHKVSQMPLLHPWDCKPYFDPDLLDDPQIRVATADTLISNARKAGTALNDIDDHLRSDPEFLKAAIRHFSATFPDFIASRWGVYCLSPSPCLTLMWSHYARDHKGICLEFAVPTTKFHAAFQVHYQKEYPSLSLNSQEFLDKLLLVKSDAWAYEQEFRLIGTRSAESASRLILDGNYLQIGPKDLVSIIMGCQIEDEARKTIRDLIREHAPIVSLGQAMRSVNKYRLIISPDAAPDK